MRSLNSSDLMKAVAIAGKISYKSKDAFKLSQGEEMTSLGVGMTFFGVAMEHAESDFKSLLASIAEMPVEEFDKQPFDFPLQVIEHLAETEDLPAFLQRVGNLTKKLFKN